MWSNKRNDDTVENDEQIIIKAITDSIDVDRKKITDMEHNINTILAKLDGIDIIHKSLTNLATRIEESNSVLINKLEEQSMRIELLERNNPENTGQKNKKTKEKK